jgi:DNA-binding NarL/FixJ family response regulator
MKVLIADDHPMVRDALARTLQALQPGVQITEASSYGQTDARLADAPDLLILDLQMPGMDGIEGVRRLRQRHPAQRMVVSSGLDDAATVRGVLGLGVAGFVSKAEPADVLAHALKQVLAGGVVLPPPAAAGAAAPSAWRGTDFAGLTQRQLEVMRLLMQGEPNKLIARQLGLSEGTVKVHIAAILRTLQARNRTEAVVMARALGLQADAAPK